MATDPSAARTGAPAARASKPGRTNSPSGRGAIAAVGRACFRHRWLVLAAWLIIAAAGFLAAGPVSNGLSNEPGAKSIESVAGSDILSKQSQVGPNILGEVKGIDPGAAAVRGAVVGAAAQIAHIPGVRSVATPYDTGLPA